MNVSQALRLGRDLYPHAIAVHHGDLSLTYNRLFCDVESVAAHLVALGIRPGQRVATDIQHSLNHWLILLALMRIGAVSVSLIGATHIALLGLAAVISMPGDEGDYPGPLLRIRVARDWLRASPVMLAALPAVSDSDQTVGRISFTSGTSGKPKAFILASNQLQARLSGTARRTCINSRSVLWCSLGPDTAYGFTAILSTWAEGGTVIFSQGGRGAYQYLTRRHLNLVVASPAALTTLLRDRIESRAPRMQGLLIVTGGRLPIELRDALRSKLCSAILIAYGASEAGGVSLGSADELDGHPGYVGKVFTDVEARIVDEEGAPQPFEQQGFLQILNAGSASAYLSDLQATTRHFRNGWFQSGDLAVLSANGTLILAGRHADVLNFGGEKIAADDVDAAAREHPGVEDACSFQIEFSGEASQLAVLIVGALPKPPELAARLRAQLPMVRCIHLLASSSIPRGSMGKVNRWDLAKKVEAALAGSSSGEAGVAFKLIGTY